MLPWCLMVFLLLLFHLTWIISGDFVYPIDKWTQMTCCSCTLDQGRRDETVQSASSVTHSTNRLNRILSFDAHTWTLLKVLSLQWIFWMDINCFKNCCKLKEGNVKLTSSKWLQSKYLSYEHFSPIDRESGFHSQEGSTNGVQISRLAWVRLLQPVCSTEFTNLNWIHWAAFHDDKKNTWCHSSSAWKKSLFMISSKIIIED